MPDVRDRPSRRWVDMTRQLPDGYELRTNDLSDDARTRKWFAAVSRGFYEPYREREVQLWRGVLAGPRNLEVVRGDRVVATSTAMTRLLSVPAAGKAVPVAAVTAVTVQPEHRRQGLMRAMLERLLDDARGAGEPLAALYASEAAIYGRFGFGAAVEMQHVEIPTRDVVWHHPPDLRGRLRVTDFSEAAGVMVAAGRRAAQRRPGLLDLRTEDLMPLQDDPEDQRDGGGERQFVVLDDDRGAVAYRVHAKWSAGISTSRAKVHALWGADAEAERSLVAYCCALDLVDTVELPYRPVDDWLVLAVDDHVRLQLSRADPLYVRVLDVPAALTARRSTTSNSVVVEVTDPRYAGNTGRWRWTVGPDGSQCAQTEDAADAGMDVRELGSLLLGGVGAHQLADAGRLKVRDAAALDRVAAAFASQPLPWAPITF